MDSNENKYDVFCITPIKGYSHRDEEKRGEESPCQDASFSGKLTDASGNTYYLLCVADGHGHCLHFRSKNGAEFAIEAAKSTVNSFIQELSETAKKRHKDGVFTYFEKIVIVKLLENWKKLVDDHLKKNPLETDRKFNDLENHISEFNSFQMQDYEQYKQGKNLYGIYGTTLLCYIQTNAYWFAFQIGDGNIAVSYDCKAYENATSQENNVENFSNATNSMCSENAENLFDFGFGEKLPKFAFCTTDGLEKACEKLPSKLYKFYYRKFAVLFTRIDKEVAKKLVKEILDDVSKNITRDDMCIAGLYSLESKKGIGNVDYIYQAAVDFYKYYKECKDVVKLEQAVDSFMEVQLLEEYLKPKKFRKDDLLLAQLDLANEKEKVNDYDGAAELLLMIADSRTKNSSLIAEAVFKLAYYYWPQSKQKASFIVSNSNVANDYISDSAWAGWYKAEYHMGIFHNEGKYQQKNDKTAKDWFKKALVHSIEKNNKDFAYKIYNKVSELYNKDSSFLEELKDIMNKNERREDIAKESVQESCECSDVKQKESSQKVVDTNATKNPDSQENVTETKDNVEKMQNAVATSGSNVDIKA